MRLYIYIYICENKNKKTKRKAINFAIYFHYNKTAN